MCEAPLCASLLVKKVAASLLGMEAGLRLSDERLQQFWSEFVPKYPAEVVEGDARPGNALVQMILAQKHEQELKYIPSKKK